MTCVMYTHSSFGIIAILLHTGTAIVCRVASRNNTYSRQLTVAHLRVKVQGVCGDKSDSADILGGPVVY